MSDQKNTIDQLASAIEVVVSGVESAIDLGGALFNMGDLTDRTPAEVYENVNKNAAAMASVYTGTSDAVKKIESIDPKDVAESARGALSKLTAGLEGEARNALAGVEQTITAAAVGAKVPSITDLVGLVDSCDSGLAFGYKPAADMLANVKAIAGADSDLGKWLKSQDDVFKAAGQAVPFIGMAVQLVEFGIDMIAAANDQMIKDTDEWMRRADIQRQARRSSKPDLTSGTLLRLDGRLYAKSSDAAIRNDILRNTRNSKSPLRLKIANQYTMMVNKHLEAQDGPGKLFVLVDGDRAFEHAKDMMLMSLIRAGEVAVSEVQALSPTPIEISQAARGTNSKIADSGVLAYMKSAPGAALWVHWNDLAYRKQVLYSSSVAIASGRRRLILKAALQSNGDVSKMIKDHPVATAGAAGAVLGGLYSLLRR